MTQPNPHPIGFCASSFWPHVVACLLVGVTAVLLCFGAMVTTYDAAMAVPDWPATYGHNMFLYPLADWFYGPWDLFLEHGHRLLGAAAGLLTMALVGVAWWGEQRRLVRGLVAAAFLLVVVQGVLGGARVLLDDRTIAKVHACTGPLFFAVTIAIATLTSRWQGNATSRPSDSLALRRLSALLLLSAYVQLVAGAQLRHLDAAIDPLTFRMLVVLHVAGAALVTGLSLAVCACAWGQQFMPPLSSRCVAAGGERSSRVSGATPAIWATVMLLLVLCQIALGAGAWIVSWGIPAGWFGDSLAAWTPTEPIVARSVQSAAIVTGHVVVGMLILGVSVVLAITSGSLEVLEDSFGQRSEANA